MGRGVARRGRQKLFQRVYRRNYWGKKGGITVSGGEPLRQLDF